MFKLFSHKPKKRGRYRKGPAETILRVDTDVALTLIRRIRKEAEEAISSVMMRRMEVDNEYLMSMLGVSSKNTDIDDLLAAIDMTSKYSAMVDAAESVMKHLEAHGPTGVPHLMDNDDNPGERLRQLIINARPVIEPIVFGNVECKKCGTRHNPIEKCPVCSMGNNNV